MLSTDRPRARKFLSRRARSVLFVQSGSVRQSGLITQSFPRIEIVEESLRTPRSSFGLALDPVTSPGATDDIEDGTGPDQV